MRKAIIVKSDNGMHEARCASCGKLLFTFRKKGKTEVDKPSLSVIIVSRCTRSSCKTDNEISFC